MRGGVTETPERSISAPESGDARRVLYLTFDGVLEPLGRSQVLRYIERLSADGVSYMLVSLEKAEGLFRAEELQAMERDLAGRGIRWIHLPYHRGGVSAMIANCRSAYAVCRRAMLSERFDLVHARAHVPAAIARKLQATSGVPYLFDMRGYWVHEKAAEGRWFTNPLMRTLALRWERSLLRLAAAVATLTDLLADDLRQGPLSGSRTPVERVGTCADFDEFTPDADLTQVPEHVRRSLAGKLVIAWVGALNASYHVEGSLRLFRLLRDLRADAHLLCITQQAEEMNRRLSAEGISPAESTVASVEHEHMPGWIAMAHWGLLLITPTFSKRGSMPTKLAEFLASGVRPIQYGCNEEVTRLVRDTGSGIVLDGISDNDLRDAAQQIASRPLVPQEVLRARELARPRLGLEHGVAVYQGLMEAVLGKRQR